MILSFFFFLLCLSAHHNPQAFTLDSVTSSLARSTDGQIYPVTTAKITCSNEDFGVTLHKFVQLTNGTLVPITIRCSDLVYEAVSTTVGYVPSDGVQQIIRSCNYRDVYTAQINASESVLVNGVISGTSLQYLPKHHPLLQGKLPIYDMQTHRIVKRTYTPKDYLHPSLQSQRGPFSPKQPKSHSEIVLARLDPISFGASCGLGSFLTFGLSTGVCFGVLAARIEEIGSDLDNLEAKQERQYQELLKLQTAEQQYREDLQRTVGGLIVANNQTTQITDALTRSQQKLILTTQLSLNASAARDAAIASDMNAMKTSFVVVGNELLAVGRRVDELQASMGASTSEAMYKLNNASYSQSIQLQRLAANLTEEVQRIRRALYRHTNTFRSLVGYIEDRDYKNQMRRELALLSHAVMNTVINGGVYQPFLDDRGVDSNIASEAAQRALLDRLYIKSAVGSVSPTATFHEFSFYCATSRLFDAQLSFMAGPDFLYQMGPAGCSSTLNQNLNCSCWVEVVAKTCSSTSARVTRASWYTNILANRTGECTGSITTQATRTFISSGDYLEYMRQVCFAGTFQSQPYIVVSAMNRAVRNATSSSSYCNANMMESLVAEGVSESGDLLSIMMTFVNSGYSILRQRSYAYEEIAIGTLPQNMSPFNQPFTRRTGQLGECQYYAFMCYSDTMLPVNRLQFSALPKYTVTVKVGGSPSANVTQTTFANNVGGMLGDYQVVVGDVLDPSQQHDLPTSELVLTEVAGARESKVTYPLCPYSTASQCNITGWMRRNGRDFNHWAGANVASFSTVSLDGTGRCVGARKASSGSLCTIRDNYQISAGAAINVVEYRPRLGASITAFINIPEGTFVDVLSSNCPAVGVINAAAGVTLTLTNSFRSDSTNTVVITGNCARTFTNVVTPAQGTKSIWIPACATGDAAQAAVFKYANDLSLVRCSTGNVSVAANRAEYLAVQQDADVTYVNLTVKDTLSGSVLALQRITANVAAANTNLMALFVATVAPYGLLGSDLLTTRLLNNSLTPMSRFTSDLQNITNYWSSRAPINYVDSNYINQMQQNIADAQANINEATRIALEKQKTNANISIDFLKTLNSSAALTRAQEAYANATRELANFRTSSGLGDFGLGGFFSGIGKGIETVGKAAFDAGKAAVNFVTETIHDVLGVAKAFFTGWLGLFSGILLFAVTGVVIGIVFFLFWFFPKYKKEMEELQKRVMNLEIRLGGGGAFAMPAPPPPSTQQQSSVQMSAFYAPKPSPVMPAPSSTTTATSQQQQQQPTLVANANTGEQDTLLTRQNALV